jgi:GNAT superfamily N-acetyltransferase
MRIRPVAPGDHPVLAEMRYEFRAELGEPSEPRDEFTVRMEGWLDRHLLHDEPTWQGWLALEGDPSTDAGCPIGHVFLHLVEKVPNPMPELELIGYVTNLYVVPGCRGRGVGAALLSRATDEARSSGCDSMVLWPSPRSITLYERHGYRRPARVMELGSSAGELHHRS